MNPVLWSKLPSELLELTLAFLPVPALCRNRTVCKKWNAIISNLDSKKRNSHKDFIVLCESKGSNILDLREWRWYTIKDKEQELFGPTIRLNHVVAIDGELVCQIWYYADTKVYVCDTLARTYTKLPSCAAMNGSIKPVINMVKTGDSYKISYIPGGVISAERPFMVIYESTTLKWRCSSPLPMKFPYGALCSVVFQELLYVLMSPSATTPNSDSVCLWSYDYVADEWKNTNVRIPDMRSVCHPTQLLVIGARLFLASWMQKLDPSVEDPESDISYRTWPGVRHSWRYVLSEIHLSDPSCFRMFEMTELDMRKLLDVRFSETCQHYCPEYIHAVGCCHAIVLICVSTGMSIVYDLVGSSWKVVPYQPRSQEVHAYRFGKPLNLVLPVHTLWFSGMD